MANSHRVVEIAEPRAFRLHDTLSNRFRRHVAVAPRTAVAAWIEKYVLGTRPLSGQALHVDFRVLQLTLLTRLGTTLTWIENVYFAENVDISWNRDFAYQSMLPALYPPPLPVLRGLWLANPISSHACSKTTVHYLH